MKVDGNTKVYKATVNGNSLTLTEMTSGVIKAGQAVILKSTNSNISMTINYAASNDDWTDNDLKGVDYETAQDANTMYYVLSKVNGVFGFFKLAREIGNSEPIKLGANKAYLAVANSTDAPTYLGFDVNDETTNISTTDFTDNTDKAGVIYDLQGRRIANGQKPKAKGLYIVNGRKFIIK